MLGVRCILWQCEDLFNFSSDCAAINMHILQFKDFSRNNNNNKSDLIWHLLCMLWTLWNENVFWRQKGSMFSTLSAVLSTIICHHFKWIEGKHNWPVDDKWHKSRHMALLLPLHSYISLSVRLATSGFTMTHDKDISTFYVVILKCFILKFWLKSHRLDL